MVSITTLLVMYTLLMSATGKLPKVAYITIFDIWMFFCIIFVFMLIITHFASEILQNRQNYLINTTTEKKNSVKVQPVNSQHPSSPERSSKLKVEEKLLLFSRKYFFPFLFFFFLLIYIILIFTQKKNNCFFLNHILLFEFKPTVGEKFKKSYLNTYGKL